MKCNKCNSEIDDDSQFCNNCGNKIENFSDSNKPNLNINCNYIKVNVINIMKIIRSWFNIDTLKKIINILNSRLLTNILLVMLLIMLSIAWDKRYSIGREPSLYNVEHKLSTTNSEIKNLNEMLKDIKYDVSRLKERLLYY